MRKIKMYGYFKCSTCKKALDFLEKKLGVGYFSIKEITKETPSLEELEKMLEFQNGNLKKIFNTSGIVYRDLGLSEKLETMPLNEAFELLRQNGMLIKRPFLICEEFGLLGFKEAEWLKKI